MLSSGRGFIRAIALGMKGDLPERIGNIVRESIAELPDEMQAAVIEHASGLPEELARIVTPRKDADGPKEGEGA